MLADKLKAFKLIGLPTVLVIVFILVIVLWPLRIIGPTEVGVKTTFGRVSDNVLYSGIQIINPISDKIVKFDTKVHKVEFAFDAGSKDLQTVSYRVVVIYRPDASKIMDLYKLTGDIKSVETNILAPNINEVTKAVTSQYNVEEVLTKRAELKAKIDKEMTDRTAKYFINIDDVSIVDVEFSKEFNVAIEAKQVAQQKAQQAEYERQKAVKDAETQIAQAKGQSEAQRLVQQTLTEPLLRKMWIEKWNGSVPQVNGSAQVFYGLK